MEADHRLAVGGWRLARRGAGRCRWFAIGKSRPALFGGPDDPTKLFTREIQRLPQRRQLLQPRRLRVVARPLNGQLLIHLDVDPVYRGLEWLQVTAEPAHLLRKRRRRKELDHLDTKEPACPRRTNRFVQGSLNPCRASKSNDSPSHTQHPHAAGHTQPSSRDRSEAELRHPCGES